MAREKTYKGVLGEWEQLNAMLAVNSADLPTLEPSRLRFADFLTKARDAAQRQAVHTAGKQESSKELKELITEGERVATMLRQGLRAHYGIRSEKLAEFGMRPFRGRKRKGQPEEEQPPVQKPEESQPGG
jgi:hypothetical protein